MKKDNDYPNSIQTASDYEKYEDAFEKGTKDLIHLSSSRIPEICIDCEEFSHDETENNEAFFSHRPCEICNRPLGGDRYVAHGWFITPDLKQHIVHMEICSDCLYYMEYGQLDDETMMNIEDNEKS